MNHFRLSALLALGPLASACAPSVLPPPREMSVASDASLLSECVYLGSIADDGIFTGSMEPESDSMLIEVGPTDGLMQAASDAGGDTVISTAAGASEAYSYSSDASVITASMESE